MRKEKILKNHRIKWKEIIESPKNNESTKRKQNLKFGNVNYSQILKSKKCYKMKKKENLWSVL